MSNDDKTNIDNGTEEEKVSCDVCLAMLDIDRCEIYLTYNGVDRYICHSCEETHQMCDDCLELFAKDFDIRELDCHSYRYVEEVQNPKTGRSYFIHSDEEAYEETRALCDDCASSFAQCDACYDCFYPKEVTVNIVDSDGEKGRFCPRCLDAELSYFSPEEQRQVAKSILQDLQGYGPLDSALVPVFKKYKLETE